MPTTAPRACWPGTPAPRLGAVGVTTNTRSVADELNYFADHTGCVGADHPAPVRRARRRGGAGAEVDRGHRRTIQRRPRHRASSWPTGTSRSSRCSVPPRPLPDRPAEPMLPVGNRLHVGDDLAPEGRGAHPRQRPVGGPRRLPTTSSSTPTSVYLVSLPFFHVNAQSWAIWSVARRRRHGRAPAEVLDQPVLGGRGQARRHATSRCCRS